MVLFKPYYQDKWVTHYCSDALTVLKELEDESIDLVCTDPPYGIGFMGKDWDRALPDKEIWAECLRVLKPGAFAFVMSIPRSDCLSRMIISLEDAGFWVNFTPIFWAYASGFPKAQNIGKAVDKRMGAERKVIKTIKKLHYSGSDLDTNEGWARPSHRNPDGTAKRTMDITAPATPQAKALDGSYGGFQPKPAVEVIIVAMKPLETKTYVDQALKNQKGITWLDDCRIPYEGKQPTGSGRVSQNIYGDYANDIEPPLTPQSGRFPANLLVSDDVLNDGRDRISGRSKSNTYDKYGGQWGQGKQIRNADYGDSGSFSRYFDLDKWAQKTFPFLVVSKASKSEKNRGLGEYEVRRQTKGGGGMGRDDPELARVATAYGSIKAKAFNNHPTVKPLKLMSYLITLGSRSGDTVLDPFGGSGTTALASKLLGRKCIIVETEEKYCEISARRCSQEVMELEC